MKKQGSWELLHFSSKGDDRGELIALEGKGEIPFKIERVYYLVNTKRGVRRGLHAHIDLDQVLIAVLGSCKVMVENGEKREEFLLDSCKKGLRITNLVWREMYDFSKDCVILVVASRHYNAEDYIRNYQEFAEKAGK